MVRHVRETSLQETLLLSLGLGITVLRLEYILYIQCVILYTYEPNFWWLHVITLVIKHHTKSPLFLSVRVRY